MAESTVRLYLPNAGPVTEADFVAYANGERVQICDVVIEDGREHVPLRLYLAHATLGPGRIDALPSSAPAFPVLVFDQADQLHAVTDPLQSRYDKEVAAAVSVMKAAWAWDERKEIPVRVNDNIHIAVPRYDKDRRWSVAVRDGAV